MNTEQKYRILGPEEIVPRNAECKWPDQPEDKWMLVQASAGDVVNTWDGLEFRVPLTQAELDAMNGLQISLEDARGKAERVNEAWHLLDDIYDWMIENDYECGEVGSELNRRIHVLLQKEGHPNHV